MFESLKRLTKHSAVYGIGHIFTRVINFLLLPLYTNELPTDEFGAYAVLFTFLAVMIIIYTYGIDAAFLRFFILSDETKNRKQVFSTAFWGVALAACLLSIVIYVFRDFWSSLLYTQGDYSHLIRLGSLILLFDALAILPFLYLRAEERSVLYTVLKFVNVIINVTLNIYFIVILGKGVEGIFLANVYASGLTFLMISFILFRNISLQFSSGVFKELVSFGLPYLPATLAVVLLDVIDRVLMERLAGLDATGIYNAGVKLGLFMALFVAAFRFAWQPFFLATSKQEDAKQIFAKVLTYFTMLGTLIFLAISFFIEEIVRLQVFGKSLIGPEFWDGTQVVPAILLAYLLFGVYVNFTVGIQLEKKTKVMPVVTGSGVLINIVLNLILIPRFGMMGAAYAKIAGYAVMCTALYIFAQRVYNIEYEFGRLLKLAAVTAVLFFLGTIENGWDILLKFALLLGFPLLLFVTGFFEKRELQKMKLILSGRAG